MTFRLEGAPSLSRFTVDRRDPLRDDIGRQAELWPSALVVHVDGEGRFEVDGDGALVLTPSAELGPSIPDGAVLLGEHDGTAYWAVPLDDDDTPAAPAATPAASGTDAARAASGAGAAIARDWTDLRRSGADLDAMAAGLAVAAVAVLGWHRRSPFCPSCGGRTEVARAGWARRCPGCRAEEYPRTDPAVICLVHDGADHVLLGRGPQWPPGRFSVLAGFVEAGESLEACVVREVAEEVGVTVRDVEYLGSQPWPFPRSLMIGFQALADRDQPLEPADGEIAEARWVHRDEVRASLDSGSWAGRSGAVHAGPGNAAPGNAAPGNAGPGSAAPGNAGPGNAAPGHGDRAGALILPGPVSIAGAMLRSWAASVATGSGRRPFR